MKTKRNIYYITRSYPRTREHAGGSSLLREGAVQLFRKAGYHVTVITPNFGSNEVVEDKNRGIILIPFTKNEKFGRILQRFGIVEDYLDQWVVNTIKYLNTRISKSDIAFSTTGGELASIKISHILKQKFNCINIVNYRDPINYASYRGLKRDKIFHINRSGLEKKYLKNADLIITSCTTFKDCLLEKYPEHRDKVFHNYFGYLSAVDLTHSKSGQNDKLKIVYGGNFSGTQSPEIICEVVSDHPQRDLIDLTLIGNYTNYPSVQPYLKKFNFIKSLPHKEFSKYLLENAMVGFVPLYGEYYKYCFPSKIFEYLNHGLVLLGSLPPGGALDFINKNEYGLAVDFKDKVALGNAITSLLQKENYSGYLKKLSVDRHQWSMEHQIKSLIEKMDDL